MLLEEENTVVEPTDDAQEETQEASAPSKVEIDYEAELKAERERREAAERKLAEDAFRAREARRTQHDILPPDDGEEEKPLTRKELLEVLRQEREQTSKQLQDTKALDVARKYAASETEAQAIIEYWRNRIVPTGDLDEDIQFAHAGLNRKRLVAQNSELKRALAGKDMQVSNTANTQQDGPKAGEPRMSSQDVTALKDAGMVWDGTKRAYKKSIAGGKKHLYFDPKTKQRWVA